MQMILKTKTKNKKGLSIIIGYILLIGISISMSILVYQWLKTYVPKDAIKCSEGTSLFIKEIIYDCTNSRLDITTKNNGKFNIDGYFIHASNKEGEEQLATIDISKSITSGGKKEGSSVRFNLLEENSLNPEDTNIASFNVAEYGTLYKIEIIPIRIQEIENKKRVVSCGDAKIQEVLTCAE